MLSVLLFLSFLLEGWQTFLCVQANSVLPLVISGGQNVTAWNITEAQRLAELSAAAYCNASTLEDWDCGYYCSSNPSVTFLTHFFDAKKDIFAYMAVNDDERKVIISFRGTVDTSIANWIVDFSAEHAKPYPLMPNISVHEGFYDAYESLTPELYPYLLDNQEKYQDYQFVITGHSLGGALATVCVLDLYLQYWVNNTFSGPLYSYTYGSPRVGDVAYAQYHNDKITSWRSVHNDDIVPHFPTQWMGFWHVETEVWWRNETATMCTEGDGEDPSCSDSVSLFDYSVEDHLRGYYHTWMGANCSIYTTY